MKLLLHSLAFFVCVFVLLCGATALAQTVTSTATWEPSPEDLFTLGTKVYSDWKGAGALAGVVALVKLFVDVTKLKVVDNWLWDHQWRWLRPVLALLLGGLSSVAAAVPLHANIAIAFVHGVLAGASAIGVNELVGMFSQVKKKKVEEAPAIAAFKAEKEGPQA